MSFYTDARRVRRNDLPFSHRLCAFRSCITLFHWLTGRGFNKTFARYDKKFDLDITAKDFNDRIIKAINALEIERRLFLEKLRVFERKRIREKMLGKRQPSKKSIEKLFEFED